MVLYLNNAEVQSLADMGECVRVLDAAFAKWSDPGAQNMPRQRMPAGKGAMNLLAGSLPGGEIFGLRTTFYHLYENSLTLFSATAGKAIAIMACGPVSTTRTGAASGVATKYLARADAQTVGCIGAGRTAKQQLLAVACVRDIKRVLVYARNDEKRAKFVAEMAGLMKGVTVTEAASAQAAVAAADIVITATNSSEPVAKGEWLAKGQHVNAIGANALDRRELDNAAYLKADLVAIDHREQGKIEAGALATLIGAGKMAWSDIPELGEIVSGQVKGRTAADQLTIYNSLGIGFEDVAYGYSLYLKAKERGMGKEVELG